MSSSVQGSVGPNIFITLHICLHTGLASSFTHFFLSVFILVLKLFFQDQIFFLSPCHHAFARDVITESKKEPVEQSPQDNLEL